MKTTFSFCLFLAGVSGFPKVWKTWIPNTNYDNPSNWFQGRIPGADDSAIFPQELELGVTLPKGVTSLRKLVLARNGEMFLPQTGVLEIKGGKGNDVEWKRRGAKAWLDPSNWQNKDASIKPGTVVPHMERLPCSADTVVFPPDSSFRVTLPEVGVPVGTVQLEGGELTNAEWQAWINTEAGSRQFIGREEDRVTAVSVKQLPMCPEKSGCSCGQTNGHSVAYLLTVVCGYAQRSCVEEVACYSPIKPIGHCCDICGGYLVLDIDAPKFDIDDLRQRVNKYLESGEYPGVTGHVGRSSDEHAQIVLVDRVLYDETSVSLAAILAKELQEAHLPGVRTITLHTSGPRALGSRWVAATSTMMGTLIAVVVCMGLVYLLFVAHPSDNRFSRLARFRAVGHPFHFARFENLAGDVEAVLQLEGEAAAEEAACAPLRQAFDNPLYGQAKSQEVAAPEDEDREVTRENPVYSELQKKQEAVDDKEDNEDEDEDDEDTETETEAVKEEKFDEILFGDN